MNYLPTNAEEFVTAVNSNGDKQDIPRRWLDHPVLGKGFRLPASATPSLSWTRDQLDAHATDHGINPAEHSTKADLLDAINNPQTPSLNPGEDENPDAGTEEN